MRAGSSSPQPGGDTARFQIDDVSFNVQTIPDDTVRVFVEGDGLKFKVALASQERTKHPYICVRYSGVYTRHGLKICCLASDLLSEKIQISMRNCVRHF